MLDVGCGNGKSMKLMKALRPDLEIEGLDFTDMTPFLPEIFKFTQGSVDNLTELYPESSFDAVVCQHVLEHLAYPVPMMNGIVHVLKKGGEVFMETPNWTRLLVPFSHLWFWSDYTHVRPSSRYAMFRILSEHGLAVHRILTVSSCAWFPQGTKRTPSDTDKVGIAHTVRPHSLGARILARAVNPLLRDVLIGIGKKQ